MTKAEIQFVRSLADKRARDLNRCFVAEGDKLIIEGVRESVINGVTELTVVNKTNGKEIPVLCELTGRTKDIMLAGGLLDYTRESLK